MTKWYKQSFVPFWVGVRYIVKSILTSRNNTLAPGSHWMRRVLCGVQVACMDTNRPGASSANQAQGTDSKQVLFARVYSKLARHVWVLVFKCVLS